MSKKPAPASAKDAATDTFLGRRKSDFDQPNNLLAPDAHALIMIRNAIGDTLASPKSSIDPAEAGRLKLAYLQCEQLLGGTLEKDAQMRDAKKRLDEQTTAAQIDGMTGLVNKVTFNQKLADHVIIARAENKPLSVIAFDADNFKAVNDTDGHDGGDKVIKKLADILHDTVRKNDVACRWGGDEFYVILPDTDEKTAKQVAERVRESVESWVDNSITMSANVTVSMGVSQLHESDDSATLVKRADTALYAAKTNGRNRVEIAMPHVAAKPVVNAGLQL